MIETELHSLAVSIDKLLELVQHIKLENNSLRKKIAQLHTENLELLNKKKQTAQAVKALITKLQDEWLCQVQK